MNPPPPEETEDIPPQVSEDIQSWEQDLVRTRTEEDRALVRTLGPIEKYVNVKRKEEDKNTKPKRLKYDLIEDKWGLEVPKKPLVQAKAQTEDNRGQENTTNTPPTTPVATKTPTHNTLLHTPARKRKVGMLSLEENLTLTKSPRVLPDECTKCELDTTLEPSVEEHVETKHTRVLPDDCTKCELNTTLEPSVEEHVETKHARLEQIPSIEINPTLLEFRTGQGGGRGGG